MRLKIVSDGTPQGTSLCNAETGEKIEYVDSIVWSIVVDNLSEAVVKLTFVQLDLEVNYDREETAIPTPP